VGFSLLELTVYGELHILLLHLFYLCCWKMVEKLQFELIGGMVLEICFATFAAKTNSLQL